VDAFVARGASGSPQAIKLAHGLPTQSEAYSWPMRPLEAVGSPPIARQSG
jgi:hypothetical protein